MTQMTVSFKALLMAAALTLPGLAMAADPAMMKDGMMVDHKGMTLYTFDKDAGGKSMCNDDCAKNWPPLMAPADAKADGKWSVIKRDDGKYVPHERDTIQHAPLVVTDFAPYLAKACKIVGASQDFPLLARCEAEIQQLLGDSAVAVRSQNYYLDVTPPAQSKGTFVTAMAERLGIPLSAVATVGDMRNDLPMFAVSGMSIAMGNASDEMKSKATDVTTSNEDDGFAGAVDLILKRNGL